MEISILATGLVCTFYTAFGGIKAVIWTDAFQIIVMLAGMLALVIRGTMNAGGWTEVMNRAKEGARFTWNLDMDPDPFVRHTFWTLVVGGFFTSLTVYASNQAMLQRYVSVRNIATARLAILLHLPVSEIFLVLVMLTGMVMYAFWYGCDPLTRGDVKKSDQLVPLFVMKTLGFLPGLPGLFVACVYSAALSTVSSGVNSLAAVTLEDFLKPWVEKITEGRPSLRLHTIVTIVSALLYGFLTIGLAYLAGVVGSTILQVALSIFGMVGGPLLGLLMVGIFCPFVNSWGAGVGLICSLIVTLWVGVGAIVNPPRSSYTIPRLNTCLCNITDVIDGANFDSLMTSSLFENCAPPARIYSPSGLEKWYSLSYQHYATLAVTISFFVGIVVSALTGFNKTRELDKGTYYDVLKWCRQIKSKRSVFALTDSKENNSNGTITHL